MTSIEMTQPINIEKLRDFERVECNIIDDKYEGIYKLYEFNNLSVICNYKNGKKNGKYESFYKNGKYRQIANYVDDLIQGESTSYFESGAIATKCNYVNHDIEGESIIYYQPENGFNGQPKYVCNYKNGKIDGEYKMYWMNGQLKEIVNYILNNNNSCKIGEEKQYYSNGQLSFICNYIIDENNNNKQHGPVVEYHYNGEVKAKYNIINEEYDGVYEEFDEQGELIEFSEYIQGVKQPNL
jgi:antitoxin component YwqK of YwqJK toxin-antitoxin module